VRQVEGGQGEGNGRWVNLGKKPLPKKRPNYVCKTRARAVPPSGRVEERREDISKLKEKREVSDDINA